MKVFKRVLLFVLGMIVIGMGYGVYYFTSSYGPTRDVQQQFSAWHIEESNDWLAFPAENKAAPGLIIYQGAKVDAWAYAPLAHDLQTAGYNVFVSKMPFTWSFLNSGLMDEIIKAYPTITEWYAGGHSLGGAMAASHVASQLPHPAVSGMFFLASYPAESFAETTLPMLFLFGENDGLIDAAKREKYLLNQSSAEANKVVIIPGANHAQFGRYGVQSGDNSATISAEQQQAAIVEAMTTWLAAVRTASQ